MPVGTPPIKLSIAREYLATLAMALQTLRPVLLVRNAFFLAARFGNQAIPEVLPNDAVLLEVDQDRRPAAFLIGDELDSGHALILPARISLGHRTAPRRCGQGLSVRPPGNESDSMEERIDGNRGGIEVKIPALSQKTRQERGTTLNDVGQRVRIQKFVGGVPPLPQNELSR